MSQKIILESCCCKSDSDDIKLKVGDTFKLVYSFKNSNFTPELKIPMNSFDVEIDYYILGKESTKYTVKKLGGRTVNCVVDSVNCSLKAILDNYELESGKLYADFKFHYYDPDLEDRKSTSKVTQYTGIILT